MCTGSTWKWGVVSLLLVTFVLGAVSAFAHNQEWSYPVSGDTESALAIGTDGTIYVCDNEDLYALNEDGTLKWQLNHSTWNVKGAPTIGPDGTIYLGSSSDDRLYAIDHYGDAKWSRPTVGNTYHTPAIGSDGTIYFGAGDTGSNGATIYALNPDNTIKWTYVIAGGSWIKASPAIGPDGTIYVGVDVTGAANRLYAFNPDGTLKWTSQDDMFDISSPAIGVDGIIYVGSAGNGLFAINPADGTTDWNLTTIGSQYYSSPVIGSDGTIYIGSTNNRLYAVDPSGTIDWSYLAGDDMNAGPVVASDGTIYIGSFDGNLYAINPTGTLDWSTNIGKALLSCPAIGSDGDVYVASYDNSGANYVYSIDGHAGGIATNTPWPSFGRNSQNYGNIREYIPVSVSPDDHEFVQNNVTFTWNLIPGNHTYVLEMSGTPDFAQPQIVETTSNSATISSNNFTTGYQHFWRVAISSDFTAFAYSDVESFVYGTQLTQPLVKAPEFDVTVSNPVGFSWEFPNANYFHVYIENDGGVAVNGIYNAPTGLFGTFQSDAYIWAIRPVNDARTSYVGDWSRIFRFAVP